MLPIVKTLSVLRCKSEDAIIPCHDLVVLLYETMHAAKGIGLAAIQIGVPENVFVMNSNGVLPRSFINPKVLEAKDPKPMSEGCLSFPGQNVIAMRYTEVTVTTQSLDLTKTLTYKLKDLEAQIFQHEFFHLKGLTMFDDCDILDFVESKGGSNE
jgi:peptide deformylase